MIIVNKLSQPLPTPNVLGFKDQFRRAGLEQRSHLTISADQSTGLKPMDVDELLEHRGHEAKKWLSRAPRWDGRDFPFAPSGQQGSAYDLPPNVCQFLVSTYNHGVHLVCDNPGDEILHILKAGEELPAGVTPIRMPVDDPLARSSEAYLVGGKVVSAGSAEPPAYVDPATVVVDPSSIMPTGGGPGVRARNAAQALADASRTA